MATNSQKTNNIQELPKDTNALRDFRDNYPSTKIQTNQNTKTGFLSNLLSFVVKILPLLFVLLLIIFGGIFIIKCTTSGACGILSTQLGFTAKNAFQATSVTNFAKWFSDVWNSGGTNLVTNLDFREEKSDIIRKLSLDDIKHDSLYSFNRLSNEGTNLSPEDRTAPINNIRSVVISEGIDKDTNVNINCKLQGYNTNGKVTYESQDTQEPSSESGLFTIYANSQGSYSIGCNFPEGINPTNEDTQVGSRIVSMSVYYDSDAESIWRPYILHSSIFKQMIAQKIDPGSYMTKDPSYDMSNGLYGMATTHSYESSESITIKSDDSMPFQEGKSYNIIIGLKSDNAFLGSLKELKQLYLTVPNTVELLTSSSNCNFEKSNSDKDGNNVYKLKQSFIDNINKACTKESLRSSTLSIETCKSTYLSDIQAYCRMTIQINDIKNIPSFLSFKANAQYIYELNKNAVLTFRKQAPI